MIPDIESVTKRWDAQAEFYTTFDSGPQTFYFTLISLLKLYKSKNILEIACGGGLLLPFAIENKQQTTPYVATDISQEMIKVANARLRKSFQLFESKLTYEEWIAKNHVHLKSVNGQQKIEGYGKFDTIICNLVLMLTPDPKQMLINLHEIAEDDARLGLTIWGDPKKNNFLPIFARVLDQLGVQKPKERSPFWLNSSIDDLVHSAGWQTVLKWEQNAAFPYQNFQDLQSYLKGMLEPNIQKLPDKTIQDKVRTRCQEVLINEFKNKSALVMSNTLMIIRKISKKI